VSNPECLGCTECIGACPEQDCLDLHFGYTSRAGVLPFWSAAAGTLVLLCLLYSWAVSSDNWTSRIPAVMIRELHVNILQMEHP
jgi:ferredoxin